MLKKFVDVQNIGLLHGSGASGNWLKTTLIYAENGRGKSTLCSLLRSLSTGDVTDVLRRRTVDQSGPLSARIVFSTGATVSELGPQGWSGPRDNIRVFDSEFVKNSVYSGGQVEIVQRRNLLSFALGDGAVAESRREATAVKDLRTAREDIRVAEASLKVKAGALTLQEFDALAAIADVEDEIGTLATRTTSAKNAADIVSRTGIPSLTIPQWTPDDILNQFSVGLQSLHVAAEARVRAHIERHDGPGFQEWLRQGLSYPSESKCPFCDQSVESDSIIGAYRQYFDESYAIYQQRLALAAEEMRNVLSSELGQTLDRQLSKASAQLEAWHEVDLQRQIEVDRRRFDALIECTRHALETLASEKLSDPLSPASSVVIEAAVQATWTEAVEILEGANDLVTAANVKVEAFRSAVEGEDLDALEVQSRLALLTQTRWDDTTVDEIVLWKQLLENAHKAEQSQTTARENVRAIMNSTLGQFEVEINQILAHFNADFSIAEMKANFRGPSAQSEYAIELRNVLVPLIGGDGPGFESALSDGDKRTLAFAFFIASLLKDADLASRVVIVDDPMSSMDANRRKSTIDYLIEVGIGAAQLAVLSHDAEFLRSFRNEQRKKDSTAEPAELELRYGANGYTIWSSASIDDLCESDYLRTMRLITEHVDQGTHTPREVGTEIRPLLESYLHRRFPHQLAEGLLLGEMLSAIRNAQSPSPLVYAQLDADEIEEINGFAGKFHHQTNPGYASFSPNGAEVRGFAKRALAVSHGKPRSN